MESGQLSKTRLERLAGWDKCQKNTIFQSPTQAAECKSPSFPSAKHIPVPLEWKYPCRLRKQIETCRMVKRDEPNHHTISHTPPFLTGFVAKVGFLRLSDPPVIARCRLRGAESKSIVMVVVMHAQCRHEAVQRAHGIQPLFRRAFTPMVPGINGAGRCAFVCCGGHILDGKQMKKFFIGRTDVMPSVGGNSISSGIK